MVANFIKNADHKEIIIESDDGRIRITNTDLHQESFEYYESICSGDTLTIGCCESNRIQFTISNVLESLKNVFLNVSIVFNHDVANPYNLGKYKVYSDTPSADRTKRTIVAYDKLYDVIHVDAYPIYKDYFDTFAGMTLKSFRDYFFSRVGLQQVETTLPNDDVIIYKNTNISPEDLSETNLGMELSGRDVLQAICEMTGHFGKVNADGKFEYFTLTPGNEYVYPESTLFPNSTLYPIGIETDSTVFNKSDYISCSFEDYDVKEINALEIRLNETTGYKFSNVPDGEIENKYVIRDNFLMFGNEDNMNSILLNIYVSIVNQNIVYKPFSMVCQSDLNVELGTPIHISTRYGYIKTYALTRKLKGIQSMRDTLGANGEEYVNFSSDYFYRFNNIDTSTPNVSIASYTATPEENIIKGSGAVIGENTTVSIENRNNLTYYISVTQTNSKAIHYVNKSQDSFTVYGEDGATFDYIVYF